MRPQPTMLLVDDDSAMLADLEPLLTQSGYTVVTAPHAELALKYLHQQHVDIVVSDVNMPPGITGQELLGRLRAEHNKVPMILMSSRPVANNAGARLPMADDYLKKPFQIDDLLARAEALLAKSTQQMTADQGCAIMAQSALQENSRLGRGGRTMNKTLIYTAPLIFGIVMALIFQFIPGILFPDPTQVPINIIYLSIGSGIVLSLAFVTLKLVLDRRERRWNEANRQIQIDAERQIADAQAAAQSRASGTEARLRQEVASLTHQITELQTREEQAQLDTTNQTARLNDESAEAVRQAEQKATKARHDFYERLDHEVKQPLQRLQSAADNLYRVVGITQGEPKNYYVRITNEIKQVNSMIEDLRQLAVMASDKQPFLPERLSLGELLSEIVSDVKSNDPRATTRDIQLNLPDFPELPPPDILGEPYNLTRVFRNLLDNAIKYTPENGKIRVRVSAPIQRDKVIVEVIDNGRGIPADELNQVWEELYRASNASQDGSRGRGMGLALVRIAVERHGGERSLERLDPPQSGTRATLAFPAIPTTTDARESVVPASTTVTAPVEPLEDAVGDMPRALAE